ncbi:class I tRNA ligase family protein, partial [Patescibacteria group bacterium]|nr:class I tRNA ligase family protein [Patescibacteria group bacterium]
MYDHKKIEPKWQKKWADKKTFEPDLANAEKPFYNLMMFPYPSAAGLHVGHTYAFGGADAYGRFKRLQGYTVFEPMGFDAFGIHSENFAIKQGIHPVELIEKTTTYYRENQMKRYGGMWDWSHEVNTTKPEYYRWTQWIFIQLFKAGLAERKKQALNWCPSCKTVLSDEQVETQPKASPSGGQVQSEQNVCERCKTVVERRQTEQWFFKITDYAEKLLDYHETDWSETTKAMQTNWIGRSEGAKIHFSIVNHSDWEIEVYTTRPDTLFGATFFVLAPEHPLVSKIVQSVSSERNKQIVSYLKQVASRSEVDREAAKEKTGVDTGLKITNPVNGALIPVFIADYVLMGYGTGAIMGVPAHDQRDWDFAKKYDLEVTPVLRGKEDWDYSQGSWNGQGELINSGEWDGWLIPDQIGKVTSWLQRRGLGEESVQFKLRDWCISRQRYWGPPIPMVFCAKCGAQDHSWFNGSEGKKQARRLKKRKQFSRLAKSMAGWFPVNESQLPVKLPYVDDYQPKGEGMSPLAQVGEFFETKCPRCGGKAVRETDVSDTFLDSAWY